MATTLMFGNESDEPRMEHSDRSSCLKHLTPYQQVAIQVIEDRAGRMKATAREKINKSLERARLDPGIYDDAVRSIRAEGRIALHFHPERVGRNRRSVAENLLQSGVYTNQFESGLSSGSPSAFRGGERDIWERRLFGDAYRGTGVISSGRPKYGVIDVMHHPDGPAPAEQRSPLARCRARSKLTVGPNRGRRSSPCADELP